MRDHNNSNLRILCYLSVTTPMLSCMLALDETVSPARILPGGYTAVRKNNPVKSMVNQTKARLEPPPYPGQRV